jgi:archaellum component FlaC
MVQSLKDHHSEIDALNQLVLNIDGDFGKVRVDMKKMQIKVHWKSIKSHIEQLEKGISQPGFTPDETLENKYRLFY